MRTRPPAAVGTGEVAADLVRESLVCARVLIVGGTGPENAGTPRGPPSAGVQYGGCAHADSARGPRQALILPRGENVGQSY